MGLVIDGGVDFQFLTGIFNIIFSAYLPHISDLGHILTCPNGTFQFISIGAGNVHAAVRENQEQRAHVPVALNLP